MVGFYCLYIIYSLKCIVKLNKYGYDAWSEPNPTGYNMILDKLIVWNKKWRPKICLVFLTNNDDYYY